MLGRLALCRRLEQIGPRRRQVTKAAVVEREAQVDLAVDALPAVRDEFGATELVMRPNDANTLRQVR